MWQNPINFLFFLGILFWIPQLQVQKEELEQDHHTLDFLTSHPLVGGATTNLLPVGPIQISAKTAPLSATEQSEPCLFSQLQVAKDAQALQKNEIILSQARVADRFHLLTAAGPILIATEGVTVIQPPELEKIPIVPFLPPSSALAWEKNWGVKEEQTVAWILTSHAAGGTQLRCLTYGSELIATGYLTAENKMAFTVSSPFTVAFSDQTTVIESLYTRISRAYLGCAFIVMMMGTLGLAILTNSILRARVNLPFEPIDLAALPWSAPRPPGESDQEYWIRRLGLTPGSLQFETFASLPSFYRYKWEDGLTLSGRKVFFVVHDRGLSFLELAGKHQIKSSSEIAWSDLYCVYFTQWNSKQSWLDIVTRSGERYQMAVSNPEPLKALLKRWDATQILDDVKAAS